MMRHRVGDAAESEALVALAAPAPGTSRSASAEASSRTCRACPSTVST